MKSRFGDIRSHLNSMMPVFFGIAFLLILYIDVRSFRHYRAAMIAQEQQQLLMIAKTVGNHLENAVQQELSEIELYFGGLEDAGVEEEAEQLRHAALYFAKQNGDAFHGILLYDRIQGTVPYSSMQPSGTAAALRRAGEATEEAEAGTAEILGKELADSGWYEMLLRYRLRNSPYDILFSANLNYLYETIVSPVKIGRNGYSVVKDKDLAIIMHHARSQIGMDAVYDRAERYPELNLTSLRAWIDRQKEEEEGSGILDSYVWDSEALEPVERIVAFTKIHFQGECWIVNSTLPMQELSGPLGSMVLMIAAFTGIYFLLLLIAAVFLTGSRYQAEAQRQEIRYLRELNQGMEVISRQKEEIRHYQRVQSLGMMASHIAHEFNNFLTPVLVYAELLEGDETISPENREMLREITGAVNRASKLSHDLLAFARQDSGSKLRLLNMTEETRAASEVVRQLCPEELRFTAVLTEEPLPIMGRDGMLQHILLNLSKNAFQAMEKTTRKELEIRLMREGDWAVLTVRDTGCGISEDARARIFEPFYTTKGSRQGTGLGLSVIQNVMNSLDGRIELESGRMQGSLFRLYFPIEEADPGRRMLRIRRISVVSERQEMEEKLRRWNREHPKYAFTLYRHPAALLSALQGNRAETDMVLSDYRLDSMSGIELLEMVRRLNDGIRLLLCTEEPGEDLQWYVNNGIIDRILRQEEFEEVLQEE